MEKLVRFGVAMEEGLLNNFDKQIALKGYENRSKAIRDLIRDSLVENDWLSNKYSAGIISMVYDHHQREVVDKVLDIQHDKHNLIISTQHIHIDHNNCLEVIITKGKAVDLKKLCDKLAAVRGVKHAELSVAATKSSLS